MITVVASIPTVKITLVAPNTRLLIETEGNIWTLRVRNPERMEVELSGTDPRFAAKPAPVLGVFVESCDPTTKKGTPGEVIIGQSFSVRFKDAVLVSMPIKSVLIQGDGWSYEL